MDVEAMAADEGSSLLGGTIRSVNNKKSIGSSWGKDSGRLLAAFALGLLVAVLASSFGGSDVTTDNLYDRMYDHYDVEAKAHKASHHKTKAHKTKHSKHSSSRDESTKAKAPGKYTDFQALGFQLYTGGAPIEMPGQDGVKNPECIGLKSHGQAGELDPDDIARNISNTLWQCYLGNSNPAEDVKHRLKIMTDAVEKAHSVATKDEDTLKIFIAPEFFWRGIDGAYMFHNAFENKTSEHHKEMAKIWKAADGDDYDPDCHEVCHVLKGLEEFVANKKYKDWLFLFGTVIVSESLPQEDAFDFVFYNFAPLYRGYDPKETDHYGKRFLVPKRYLSQIDFLTPARLVNANETKELIATQQHKHKHHRMDDDDFDDKYDDDDDTVQPLTMAHNPFFEAPNRRFYDQEVWEWYKGELNSLGYTMLEYDWLILDDITFTVEICVDHLAQTALNTFIADTVLGRPTLIPKSVETYDKKHKKYTGEVEYVGIPRHMAQLSLVSSSGMMVEPTALALADKGTIILQDGQTDREGEMKWISECDWFSWHFEGGSQHVTRTAQLTNTEISFEYYMHPGWAQHGIWDDLEDATDTTWKDKIAGAFTTARYEPKITVYSPQEIAKV